MNRAKHTVPLAFLVTFIVVVGCASLGGGRPGVVRAEDVLTNSLSVWGRAMVYHQTHAAEEKPEVYRVLEAARIAFPPAWKALDEAIVAYKKSGDAVALQRAAAVVEAIVKSLKDSGVL